VSVTLSHKLLTVLDMVGTYIGRRKLSLIVANNATGKCDWKFADPVVGGLWVAFSGTLEECHALKAEYEAPAADIPF
jgi:hypothetical protein